MGERQCEGSRTPGHVCICPAGWSFCKMCGKAMEHVRDDLGQLVMPDHEREEVMGL